jgi:hypothetical protein
LTLLFAILFLAMGFFRLITSIWYRFPNWGGVALSGAVSIALGLMLWNPWPASRLWFIGLCLGAGWLGRSARSRWLTRSGRGRIPASLGAGLAPFSGPAAAEPHHPRGAAGVRWIGGGPVLRWR